MMKSYVLPVLVLSLICMAMTGALALVNNVTGPIIAQASRERAEVAMMNIIPEATGFELVQSDLFPAAVYEVYRTTNNVGYVFMVATSGYGGIFRIICGIDGEGRIISSSVLPPHTETPGLGTSVFEQASAYVGLGSSLEGVNVVTGSTITFNAYRRALQDAFAAYYIVRGDGQ